MKRTLPPNLSLEEIQTYVNMHKRILGGSDTDWTIDKKNVLNTHLCVVPKEQFVFKTKMSSDEYKSISIKVDGGDCGTFGQPNVTLLMKLAKPAVFGKGGKEVYDTNVRLALAIDKDRIKFGEQYGGGIFSSLLYNTAAANKDFKAWSGADAYTTKLYKMHIYPKGGKFDTHVDTPHGDNHIASGIFILDSAFKGGELIIEHGDQKESIVEPGTLAAWYNDCPHRVEEVTEGFRIVLQFDVMSNATLTQKKEPNTKSVKDGSEDSEDQSESSSSSKSDSDEDKSELHPYLSNDHSLASPAWETLFLKDLSFEMEDQDVALLLEHTYFSDKTCPAPENLKGRDRLLWLTLAKQAAKFDIGLVAIVSEYQEEERDPRKVLRSLGPLTAVPNESKRSVLFIPGPDSNMEKIMDQHGADHTGNEPMMAESTYVGVVIYCAQKKKEE